MGLKMQERHPKKRKGTRRDPHHPAPS